MPIINSTRKINPLDVNNKVNIGVAFPLNDTNMTAGTQTMREQLKSNFLNLLMTNKGERINLPTYGYGLLQKVFENSISKEELKSEINSELQFWLPELVVTEVDIKDDSDKHISNIAIAYTIVGEPAGDAIQVNVSQTPSNELPGFGDPSTAQRY
tara:strand:- start:122 stop:586 length:465 start_codon:yes stop_codon:yes gene_type:complete